MQYDAWFDSDENKALLAVCTRRHIRSIGVGGVIWGLFNLVLGAIAVQFSPINIGVPILGVLMLGTGIQALRRPTLGVLLAETIVTVLLLFWNLGMTVVNAQEGVPFDVRGVIFPAVIASVLASHYRKLGSLRELIATISTEQVATTKKLCKEILKKKWKTEPSLVEARGRRCRAQLFGDRMFLVQRDIMRAFVCSRVDLFRAVAKPEARSWTAVFNHPLGKLKYSFDKKNTERLRAWLAVAQEPDGVV